MKCGFYETEITPPLGTTIFGYFVARANEGVLTKLYAKAAVFESNGKTVAFLVLDALLMPKGLADFVRDRVNEKTGIEKDAILIATTHSHTSGPGFDNLGNFKDRIKLLDEEPRLDAELDKFYLEMVCLLSADAVIHAYQRLEDAEISFAEREPQNINFVREYVLKNGEVRTNPADYKKEILNPVSEPDRKLPIFFVRNKAGKPMGLITSFALHHDTIKGSKMCADYSGYVADNLKEKYGRNFTTLFYSGFCGNINHLNFMNKENHITETSYIVQVLTDEIIKAETNLVPLSEDELDYRWETVSIRKREVPKEHTERVIALKKNPPVVEKLTIADPYCDIMVYAGANSYIGYYVEDARTEYDVPVHVLKIGECLVYSFIGEIFSQFSDMIREKSPSDKIMLVTKGNTDKINCYVPTREMFLPYVYESTYTSATLCPDAGYQMVDLAIEMANEMHNA